MRITQATLLTAVAATCVGAPCAAATIYQIGNSLTNDSTPWAVRTLAEAALGEPVESGWHIRSNSSLKTIWENATRYTITGGDPAGFLNALPQREWDHIALQVFPAGSNLSTDLQAARNFMDLAESNPANADTVYYIYAAWPLIVDFNDWYEPVEGLNPPTAARKDYFELVVDRLAEERPGRVRLIPVGEVFQEVVERGRTGELGVVASLYDLYRDFIHASEIGRFLAATTVAATITRENPAGWPVEPALPGLEGLDELGARALQQIIWEVLIGVERSGVAPRGDINTDTRIDADDYAAWAALHGANEQLTADVNGDDRVNGFDAAIVGLGIDPGAADVSGDGVANIDDYAKWVASFGAASGGDANGDGTIDAADYTLIRDAIHARSVSDLNGDGEVDSSDGQIVDRENGWSTSMREDLNDDGVVDAADYTIWRDAQALWAPFNGQGAVAVPEPATVIIAAAASVVTRRRRRRR